MLRGFSSLSVNWLEKKVGFFLLEMMISSQQIIKLNPSSKRMHQRRNAPHDD
jgi:hypothetical protein